MPAAPITFGPFSLDVAQRTLARDGQVVALPPKAFDLLVVLVESAGEVVAKDELMRRLWPDTFVEDGNLPVAVFTLRKALGELGETFVQTVPRRGYRFVGPVLRAEVPAQAPAASPAAPTEPSPSRPDQGPAPAAPPGPAADGPSAPPAAARSGSLGWGLVAAALLAGIVLLGVGYARRSAATPATAAVRSMAVLPFAVVDAGDGDEFVGQGLAADVAERLRTITSLAARPPSSSLKYGTDRAAAVDAGRALRADVVVTGTIRRTAHQVRITAEATRVADGARVWQLAADREDQAWLQAAGAVATDVAAALVPDLGADARLALSQALSVNEAAYRAYLEGLALGAQLTLRDVEAAAERFERAIAADPGFARAHAALAVHALLPTSAVPTPARLARAKAAARAALALDPGLAAAHAALGFIGALADHEWEAAGDALRHAVALAPTDPEVRLWYALHLGALARHDAAIQEADRALELDPTGARANFYRGFLLLMARRYDEAINQFRQTPLELGVVTQQVALGLAVAGAKRERFEQATRTLERIFTRAPSPQARVHLAFVKAEAGDRAAAARLLRAALAPPAPARTPRVMMAAAQACLGETDAAFENLFKAEEDGDLRIVFAGVDPTLDCARGDARFAALLAHLGLAHAAVRR